MLDLVQGSPEWLAARAGSLGASGIADIMARTKTGWSASRATARARIITERLTGQPVQSFKSAAMQRGNDLEPQARAYYSLHTGNDVVEVGIVPHPRITGSHCSPDGLVGETGMVEIKCCEAPRHIELLAGDEPEARYIKQCQWQLACTDREWVDLAYFHPDMPASMQLVVHRIDRDPAMIAEMESAVIEFLAEVEATLADLRAKYERKAA